MSRRSKSLAVVPVLRSGSVPREAITRALVAAGFAFFSVTTTADWFVITLDFETMISERRCLAADVLAEIGYDVAQVGAATLVIGEAGTAKRLRDGYDYMTGAGTKTLAA